MIIGSELLHPEWDYDSFRLLPQAVSTDGDPQWGVQVPTTDVCCRHCGVLRWAASCFYFGMSRMRAIIINGWHLRVLPSLAFSLLLSLSIFPVFFFFFHSFSSLPEDRALSRWACCSGGFQHTDAGVGRLFNAALTLFMTPSLHFLWDCLSAFREQNAFAVEGTKSTQPGTRESRLRDMFGLLTFEIRLN